MERGIHAGHTDDREECRSQLVFRPKTIRPKIPCLPWLATGRTRRSIGLPIVSRGGANPFFCPNFITFFAGGTMGSTSAGHSAARTASGSSLRGTRCGSGPDPANTPVGPGQHREHHRVKDQMAESHRLLPERNPGQQKILSANQAGKPMFRRSPGSGARSHPVSGREQTLAKTPVFRQKLGNLGKPDVGGLCGVSAAWPCLRYEDEETKRDGPLAHGEGWTQRGPL